MKPVSISQMRGIFNVLNIFLLPHNIWPWNQEQLLFLQTLSSTERCRNKAQLSSWVKCGELSAQSCCAAFEYADCASGRSCHPLGICDLCCTLELSPQRGSMNQIHNFRSSPGLRSTLRWQKVKRINQGLMQQSVLHCIFIRLLLEGSFIYRFQSQMRRRAGNALQPLQHWNSKARTQEEKDYHLISEGG